MARGIRGFLKKLLDIPLDIVYEVRKRLSFYLSCL